MLTRKHHPSHSFSFVFDSIQCDTFRSIDKTLSSTRSLSISGSLTGSFSSKEFVIFVKCSFNSDNWSSFSTLEAMKPFSWFTTLDKSWFSSDVLSSSTLIIYEKQLLHLYLWYLCYLLELYFCLNYLCFFSSFLSFFWRNISFLSLFPLWFLKQEEKNWYAIALDHSFFAPWVA